MMELFYFVLTLAGFGLLLWVMEYGWEWLRTTLAVGMVGTCASYYAFILWTFLPW
jgi:hypothetical protein